MSLTEQFEDLSPVTFEPVLFEHARFFIRTPEGKSVGAYMTLADLVHEAKRLLSATKLERWDDRYTFRNAAGELVGVVSWFGHDPIQWAARE